MGLILIVEFIISFDCQKSHHTLICPRFSDQNCNTHAFRDTAIAVHRFTNILARLDRHSGQRTRSKPA